MVPWFVVLGRGEGATFNAPCPLALLPLLRGAGCHCSQYEICERRAAMRLEATATKGI